MKKFHNAWLDTKKISGVILTPKKGYSTEGLAVEVELDETEYADILFDGISGVIRLMGENAKEFGEWWTKGRAVK